MTLFGNILFIFITLSLDRSIYRCYFDYTEEIDRKVYIGTITISLIVVSSFFTIFLFVLKDYVSLIFISIPFYPYYSISIITSYIIIIYSIAKIFLQITEQSRKFVTYSIVYFMIDLLLTIVFVVFLHKGAIGKMYATLIAGLVFLPISGKVIIQYATFKFNWGMLKSSLKYSLPVIPTLLSAWVLNLSDRIFIERYFSLADVGIYSMGYKLADTLLIFSVGFFTAYSPLFFKTAISVLDSDENNILISINNQFVLAILLVSSIAFMVAEEVVTILLDPKYYESYLIFKLIIVGYVFHIIFGLVNSSFAQGKKMITMMFINLGSAILNIALNMTLIPTYGIYGAAYATIISFAIFGIVKYSFARSYYFIEWQWKKIFKYVTMIIASYMLSEYISSDNMMLTLLIKLMIILFVIMYYWYDNKQIIYGIRNYNY